MMIIVFILILAGAVLSIYAGKLYHDLYLKGYHNRFGRKVNLKLLKLIVSQEMPIEDKVIAEKCLKLYYCYLIVFYSSCLLMVCYLVNSIYK